jgi:hypothetical protein
MARVLANLFAEGSKLRRRFLAGSLEGMIVGFDDETDGAFPFDMKTRKARQEQKQGEQR